MALNVVASQYIVNNFKKSRYFKQNLGLVTTVENSGRRSFNNKDKFSYFYSSQYKTSIYAQGNVGDVKFYIDHYIKDDTFAIYNGDNFEEFIYTFDENIVGEKVASSKLTENQIHEIRKMYVRGVVSLKEVGEKFGVAFQTISKIVNKSAWKHI